MVSGCDRELNAYVYSAASLKYYAPDTWHDTTPSHIILTLGRSVLALPHKSWVPSEEQLVPSITTLVCRCLGSNPWPPVPRSGQYFCQYYGPLLWFILGAGRRRTVPRFLLMEFIEMLSFFSSQSNRQNKHNDEELELLGFEPAL